MADKGKLYTFLHESGNFSVKFLCFDGDKLQTGRTYFDLCFLHLLAYFKEKEQMCAYFDGEKQPINYKLEASPQGIFRSLLMVNSDQFQPLMSGIVRILKLLPGAKSPAQSIVRIEDQSPRDMVQEILNQSYQIESALMLEAEKGQSLLVSALPQKTEHDFKKFFEDHQDLFASLISIDDIDGGKLIEFYEKQGFNHLTTVDLNRSCPCSKDYILANLKKLATESLADLFQENEQSLEANCDYCQKAYSISKKELLSIAPTN